MANITITLSTPLSSGTLGTHTLKAQRSTITGATTTSSFADYSPTVTGSATSWTGGISVPYDYENDAKIQLVNITSGAFCENTISNELIVDSRPTSITATFIDPGTGNYEDLQISWTAPTNVGAPTSYDLFYTSDIERTIVTGYLDTTIDVSNCFFVKDDGSGGVTTLDGVGDLNSVSVRANYGGDSSLKVAQSIFGNSGLADFTCFGGVDDTTPGSA